MFRQTAVTGCESLLLLSQAKEKKTCHSLTDKEKYFIYFFFASSVTYIEILPSAAVAFHTSTYKSIRTRHFMNPEREGLSGNVRYAMYRDSVIIPSIIKTKIINNKTLSITTICSGGSGINDASLLLIAH